MQPDSALCERGAGGNESGQIFVFDRNEFGGVLGDVFRLRDDQNYGLTDKADAFMGQPGSERNAERAAADTFEERDRRRALPARCDKIGPGQDIQHAWQVSCDRRVDARDLGVRPVGPQKVARDLPIEGVVCRVTALPRQQSQIFAPAFKLML